MTRSSGITLLSKAASALKSTGASVPINKQIDAVSNTLTGTKREREVSFEGEGFPSEAKNVLEILKIQVNKAVEVLSEEAANQDLYNKLVSDLEVIESFADRIIQFYQPNETLFSQSDLELTNSVKQSFAKAKSEAVTAIALEKIFSKITNLESWYRNNSKLTANEYRKKLDDLSSKIRKWEDEIVPANPMLCNSQTVTERIYHLKTKLHEAIEISELQKHPGIVGETALQILRIASEMVQHAKSQFEIEQAATMAADANKNLQRSGRQYQERGISFNLLIQQSIALFVSRQIKKMEAELKAPYYYFPGDAGKNDDVAKRLINQMERLTVYFEFVDKWGGPHEEDLIERIALVYEKIVERAEKSEHFALDEASRKGTEEKLSAELSLVAAKFRLATVLGCDKIKPQEIFHEKPDAGSGVRKLLDSIPDPANYLNQIVSFDKLGRVYYQAMTLRGKETENLPVQQMLSTVLNRIEFYLLKKGDEIDVFLEMDVRSIYLKSIIEQEVYRFLSLLNMNPSLTLPKRYSNYPDPSRYPFKGRQLAKVMRNFRIVSSFLGGSYGKVGDHPAFLTVFQGLEKELDEYCTKVFLELHRKLDLSIIKPQKLDAIENILEERIHALPKNCQSIVKSQVRIETTETGKLLPEKEKELAEKLQSLWIMLEFLRYPERMRQIEKIENVGQEELITFSENAVKKCRPDLLDVYLNEVKKEFKRDDIALPFTKSVLEKISDDKLARKALKFFVQLQSPKMRGIESFTTQILQQCQVHKSISEAIICPLAERNPGLLQRTVAENINEVIADAEKITFKIRLKEIEDLNEEGQFYKDHCVPESLPLYVEAMMLPRGENENVKDRLLSLIKYNGSLLGKVESLATKSMFQAIFNKIKGMHNTLSGVPGLQKFSISIDDFLQFLFFEREKGIWKVEGFAQLSFTGPVPDTDIIDEVGSVIVKIEVNLDNGKQEDATLSFINKPYNAFISSYREGKGWCLL